MNFVNFKQDTFITSDDFSLYYGHNFESNNIDKSKPTLIFNYGLVCNLAHWKFQIPYFEKLGYPILFHDYRFHFQSSSSKNIDDLTFTNIANDIFELMEHCNITDPIMLGHSMGVNTTLEFTNKFPNNLKGMVLISGTVLPPQDIMFDTNWMDIIQPMLELLLEKYPKVFNTLWKTGHKNPIANHAIHKGGFNTKKVPKEFVTYYLKKIGELSPDVFFKLLDEMREQNITSKLSKINTPTLVMSGDLDQVIPSYLQKILTDNLPESEMYIIKDGSHVPQADFPATVNERISIFLEGL
jgi:pimeloyl-ACP methyl ester carboxylesterase